MAAHDLTLAVTNADGDVLKLFHVRRDGIQSVADTWKRGVKSLHERNPHEPNDPVLHAWGLLRDMVEDDLPRDQVLGTAAVYLLSKSLVGDGPTIVTILEDGFEIEPAPDELAALLLRAEHVPIH